MFQKNLWHGQCQLFLEMKEGYKVSCIKILIFAKLLGGWYLFEV